MWFNGKFCISLLYPRDNVLGSWHLCLSHCRTFASGCFSDSCPCSWCLLILKFCWNLVYFVPQGTSLKSPRTLSLFLSKPLKGSIQNKLRIHRCHVVIHSSRKCAGGSLRVTLPWRDSLAQLSKIQISFQLPFLQPLTEGGSSKSHCDTASVALCSSQSPSKEVICVGFSLSSLF